MLAPPRRTTRKILGLCSCRKGAAPIAKSLVRLTESGDFVDSTKLEQTPSALLLDTSGKLLIATAKGVLSAHFPP
jgi:hypothetical protein